MRQKVRVVSGVWLALCFLQGSVAWAKLGVPPKLILKEKSHYVLLREADVLAWINHYAQRIQQELGKSLRGQQVLLEHARVAGQQTAYAGMELADPDDRQMFVVIAPVVKANEPWRVEAGRVVIDGQRREIVESEGSWQKREERIGGKRIVHTKVQGQSTERVRERGALEPVAWEDAVSAPTLTLWVDRYGRIYYVSGGGL